MISSHNHLCPRQVHSQIPKKSRVSTKKYSPMTNCHNKRRSRLASGMPHLAPGLSEPVEAGVIVLSIHDDDPPGPLSGKSWSSRPLEGPVELGCKVAISTRGREENTTARPRCGTPRSRLRWWFMLPEPQPMAYGTSCSKFESAAGKAPALWGAFLLASIAPEP